MPIGNAPKRLLFGPGPGQVEASVYQAMTQPLVGHLDPYFFEVVNDIRTGLRAAFGTSNEMTLAISGTGSAGMETAVCNFVEPGSKFGIFSAGYFAERIAEMGRRHGAAVIQWQKPWGSTFSDEEVADLIRRDKPQTVAFVHAETSTGALQKAEAICDAAHEIGALVIADTVTSLGAVEIAADANGIDVAYSCTQKGLSVPPGLAPITISPRALERLDAKKDPADTWYLDLKLLREYYDAPHKYHHTAPISMFYALQAGLQCIADEGLAKRWQRHRDAHDRFVSGIRQPQHGACTRRSKRCSGPLTPDAGPGYRDRGWLRPPRRQNIPRRRDGTARHARKRRPFPRSLQTRARVGGRSLRSPNARGSRRPYTRRRPRRIRPGRPS